MEYTYTTKNLRKSLVDNKIVTDKEFDVLLEQAKAEKNTIEMMLISKNIISEPRLAQLTSKLSGCPYANLRSIVIGPELMQVIPEVVSRSQKIVAFEQTKKDLKVAMADPNNLEIINLLKKRTGLNVIIYCAAETDINNVINTYSKGILGELKKLTIEQKPTGKTKPEDLSIIRIIDIILRYAYENKASDIHIEPYKSKTVVRYRIDGILHDVVTFSKELHPLVVSRIKILSNLRTDEHRAAQDGRFGFQISLEDIDVRVSVIPTITGEKVVMRILSKKNAARSLEGTGLVGRDLDIVRKHIKRPHGMLLATGPTGSGKTTTLYSILQILNKREVNISTIEDPVEYNVEGINQVQVQSRTGLTFATGLRSLLRQDPNIIMVGEIRDDETASIAINAALTGHLVLSTLHTNNAATTLPRFMDMGIEPFLVATTTNIIIAQRLIRKVCNNCMEQKVVKVKSLINVIGEKLVKKYFPDQETFKMSYGTGCKVCNHSGYKGRIGLFEIMEIDEDVRALILQRADSSVIEAKAMENGMTRMIEDGLRKVVSGMTTVEEVLKSTEVDIDT